MSTQAPKSPVSDRKHGWGRVSIQSNTALVLPPILKPAGDPHCPPAAARRHPAAILPSLNSGRSQCVPTLPCLETGRGCCCGCGWWVWWGTDQHHFWFSFTCVPSCPPRPFLVSQLFICLWPCFSSSPQDRPNGTRCVTANPAQTAYLPSRQDRQRAGSDAPPGMARPGNAGLDHAAGSPPVPSGSPHCGHLRRHPSSL